MRVRGEKSGEREKERESLQVRWDQSRIIVGTFLRRCFTAEWRPAALYIYIYI